MSRKFGKVVRFDRTFGFISTEESNYTTDIFVRYDGIVMKGYKKLIPGQRVSYEIGSNHIGPTAINVMVEEDPVKTE